ERKRARSEAGTATVERPQAHPQTLQQLLGVRLRLLRKRLAHLRAGQHALEHLVELSTLEELLKRLLGLWTVEELLEDLLDLRLEHDDEPLRRRSDLLAAATCGPLDVRLEPRRPRDQACGRQPHAGGREDDAESGVVRVTLIVRVHRRSARARR